MHPTLLYIFFAPFSRGRHQPTGDPPIFQLRGDSVTLLEQPS